jgi:hypothetical protein
MSSFHISRRNTPVPLTHGASATTNQVAAAYNGILLEVIIKTPTAVDAAATITVNILDSDNNIVYTKSGIAANTTSINLLTNDLRVPLSGTQSIQVVFSAAQTATDTVTNVTLLIQG